MGGRLALVPSGLVVAAVPVLLAGNAMMALVNPWLVHVEYALPGFPDDTVGLSDDERSDLAVKGLKAIRPGGDGVDVLREATLPNGAPAFREKEISHMEDVRVLIVAFLVGWTVAFFVALGSILAIRRLGGPVAPRIRGALAGGAWLTIGVMAVVGVVMLLDFEFFFDEFHGVFFEGDSWRFKKRDTLRNLYPDQFWGVAGGTMAALVIAQAAGLIGGVRWHARRRTRTASTPTEE